MVLIIPKLKALNNMSSFSSVLVKEYSNEIVEKSCLREVMFLSSDHLGPNSIKKFNWL